MDNHTSIPSELVTLNKVYETDTNGNRFVSDVTVDDSGLRNFLLNVLQLQNPNRR